MRLGFGDSLIYRGLADALGRVYLFIHFLVCWLAVGMCVPPGPHHAAGSLSLRPSLSELGSWNRFRFLLVYASRMTSLRLAEIRGQSSDF